MQGEGVTGLAPRPGGAFASHWELTTERGLGTDGRRPVGRLGAGERSRNGLARINALASATEGRELSGGKASMAPSGTSAASASRLIGFMAFSFAGHATGRGLRKLGADVLAGLG